VEQVEQVVVEQDQIAQQDQQEQPILVAVVVDQEYIVDHLWVVPADRESLY
jgi:hypothetical protein